jgi:transposase
MPGSPKWWTEWQAQEAFALRHFLGWSNRQIASKLKIHIRTVARYMRMVEQGEVPWPPPEYRYRAQHPSQHHSASQFVCWNCKVPLTIPMVIRKANRAAS